MREQQTRLEADRKALEGEKAQLTALRTQLEAVSRKLQADSASLKAERERFDADRTRFATDRTHLDKQIAKLNTDRVTFNDERASVERSRQELEYSFYGALLYICLWFQFVQKYSRQMPYPQFQTEFGGRSSISFSTWETKRLSASGDTRSGLFARCAFQCGRAVSNDHWSRQLAGRTRHGCVSLYKVIVKFVWQIFAL